MPTLATMQAAIPKCRKGACPKVLRWSQSHDAWECPEHGRVLSGPMAALAAVTFDRQRIIEEKHAA